MDNFQAIIMGRPVEVDLVDDGWTHHYAAVQHPPRPEGMTHEPSTCAAPRRSTTGSWRRTGAGSRSWWPTRPRPRSSSRTTGTCASARVSTTSTCRPSTTPTSRLIDCPGGIDRITERGPVVDGQQYEVDCIIYGTGFEAELTPLFRRVGHDIVGRGGVTLAEKWADGAASLFGMMSRGFPNMFVMPAPGQQAVVTVNYTQLAVLGAEFIGACRRAARADGAWRCST